MNNKEKDKMLFKDLVVLYHKLGFGDIAKSYSVEEENKFYSLVISKLAKKYPKFVNYKEAYDLLKDNGQIFTISTIGKKGFYDEERNIIGIRHFLNRLTTTIFHEIVHKLSYLIGKGEITKLPEVYKEAGTEYITAETLKTRTTRACVFSNIWGKFPNTISSYYLDYIFVRQLNTIIGGEALEETILKGNLTFENKLKEQIGILKYNAITKKMTEIDKDFYSYAAYYDANTARENIELRDDLIYSIKTLQNTILRAGFDDKIKNVNSPEEAQKVLNSLLAFADLRLREEEGGKYTDREFEKYFNNTKNDFSIRFPKENFNQEFNPNDWRKKYTRLGKIEQIPLDEEEEIKRIGKENYKKYKESLLKRIFSNMRPEDNLKTRIPKQSRQARNFNEELKVGKTRVSKPKNQVHKIRNTIDKPRDVN